MNVNKIKLLKGVVVSNKMNKTVIVRVDRKVQHKLYKKLIVRSTKYFVHDENNSCNIGNIIFFRQTIPISKFKHWSLVSIELKG